MTTRHVSLSVLTVAAILSLLVPPAALADLRITGGVTFVEVSKPRKPKRLDDMRSALRIPSDFDQKDDLEYSCYLSTLRGNHEGVAEVARIDVRAEWRTRAYVLDPRDGEFQSFEVDSGTVSTGERGALFNVPIPDHVVAAIFGNGFASGNRPAFLVSEVTLKQGKRLTFAAFDCEVLDKSRPVPKR